MKREKKNVISNLLTFLVVCDLESQEIFVSRSHYIIIIFFVFDKNLSLQYLSVKFEII